MEQDGVFVSLFLCIFLLSFLSFLLLLLFLTQYRETKEHFVKCMLDVIASTQNPGQGDLDLNLKE